jgi:hypothetical protein
MVRVLVKGRVEVERRGVVLVVSTGERLVAGAALADVSDVCVVGCSELRGVVVVSRSLVVGLLGVGDGSGLLLGVVVSSVGVGEGVGSGSGVLVSGGGVSVGVFAGADVVLPVPWACRFSPW